MARAKPRPPKRRDENFVFKTSYNSNTADPIVPVPKKKRHKLDDLGDDRIHEADDSGAIDAKLSNEDMEKRVAFCCYQCFCSEEKKRKLIKNPFAISSDDGLFHRKCCHNLKKKVSKKWKSPYEIAIGELSVELEKEILPDASSQEELKDIELPVEEEILPNKMTDEELKVQYDIAQRNKEATYKADEKPGTNSFVKIVI
jgi:hypothetical protein